MDKFSRVRNYQCITKSHDVTLSDLANRALAHEMKALPPKAGSVRVVLLSVVMKCQAIHRNRDSDSPPSEWPQPPLEQEIDHMTDNQAYSFLSLITYSDGRVQWNTVALLKFPFVVFAGEEL